MSATRLTVPQLTMLAEAVLDGQVVPRGAELITARLLRRMGLLRCVTDRVYAPTDGARSTIAAQHRDR